MSHRAVLSRSLTSLAAASLLAACQGGTASPPPLPGTTVAQSAARLPASAGQSGPSAARSTQHREKKDGAALSASPASLEFTPDQVAAATAQTVAITSKSGGKLAVTIAGTGNCPAVSPASLQLKRVDEDGDRDRDHHDRASGTLTVTPAGAGPASCTITVAAAKAGHGHDGDRDRDRDRHDDDDAGASLTIAVTVDAPPSPTPVPSVNPCANNSCR